MAIDTRSSAATAASSPACQKPVVSATEVAATRQAVDRAQLLPARVSHHPRVSAYE